VTLPARRIDGSCSMPDYPEQVVARDAQLALTLSVLVDAGGKPGPIEVVAPSGFPDYDRAVLAAVEHCRYVPALNGSTPVAQAVTLSLRREPGSQRP
jgi:TonB family protein